MVTYIIIGVVIYLLIGIGLLIWAVKTDPWGGLMLHFAVPFVLLYPFLIIRSIVCHILEWYGKRGNK